MNRLKQTVLIVAAMCVGCALLIGSAWMAEGSAAQSFGPSVGNSPAGPRKNQPAGNRAKDIFDNTPELEPLPESESAWKDYDLKDLDNAKRLPQRPGNYLALATLADFIDGLYQVAPEYRRLAFPFMEEEEITLTAEEWAEGLKDRDKRIREGGEAKTNKVRQYNICLESLKFYDLPPGETITDFDAIGLKGAKPERFKQVRKWHPEYSVLCHFVWRLESLQSDKIEKGDGYWVYIANKKGEWKVCWFDD